MIASQNIFTCVLLSFNPYKNPYVFHILTAISVITLVIFFEVIPCSSNNFVIDMGDNKATK